jgi:hypothetical protein
MAAGVGSSPTRLRAPLTPRRSPRVLHAPLLI